MQNHKKHYLLPPCAFEVHHTYLIHTTTYESVYMYLKVFLQHSLTHYLPTANLYLTIKDTSTTSPKSNSTPIARIQYLPTWYIVQTTLPSLIGPHTYQYYILIYTGAGGVRRQVVYQTVTATLDFDKGYDSS